MSASSRNSTRLRAMCTAVAMLSLPAAMARGGVSFDFSKGPGITALENGAPPLQRLATDIMDCFAAAGDTWAQRLTDDITVRISVDWDEMGVNVLGTTRSETIGKTYTQVRNALVSDATTPDDAIAVAHLQTNSSLDMLTRDTSAAPPTPAPLVRDNDGSTNNTTMDVNRATAKALGLLTAENVLDDGSIIFSSLMDWDFDRSDGISYGAFDFVGVATHEIGHLMGFVSGVDIVDVAGGPDGPSAPMDLDGYRVFGVRDLFRYSADSLAEPNQPSTGAVLDLATGTDAFFSIDAGATNLAAVATGRYNGDGQQASHWKDGLGLGIFDPTAVRGSPDRISALDLLAMDVMGYDRTPASRGDFDADGAVDAADIDALQAALAAADQSVAFDVNFDDVVDAMDAFDLIYTNLGSSFGDADLDGDVDLNDFVLLKINFGAGGAGWAQGDFNGDKDVDLDDFVLMKNNFGSAAVPEPAVAALLACGASVFRLGRRRGRARRSGPMPGDIRGVKQAPGDHRT